MNSLTYWGISRDHALSRSPAVNMSGQARQPRREMATYSRKSTTTRGKLLKRQPTKYVLVIQEAEDPKTRESEAEIGGKMSKELRSKYKQLLVQLTRGTSSRQVSSSRASRYFISSIIECAVRNIRVVLQMAEVESRSVYHVTWQEIDILKQLKSIDLC